MVSNDVNRPASTGSQQDGHVSDRISQLSTHCKWYWCMHGRYRMLSPKIERNFHRDSPRWRIKPRPTTYQLQNRSCKCHIRSEFSLTWSFRLWIDGWANVGWGRFAWRFWSARLPLAAVDYAGSCLATGKISAGCFPAIENLLDESENKLNKISKPDKSILINRKSRKRPLRSNQQ